MKPLTALLKPALDALPRQGELAAELMPYYEEGVSAGAAGHSIDDCRYRRQDRVAAWTRGWHDGRAQRPGPTLTDEERAAGRAGIAKLRIALGPLPSPEGWVRRLATWHYLMNVGQTRCGIWINTVAERLNAPAPENGETVCIICRGRI